VHSLAPSDGLRLNVPATVAPSRHIKEVHIMCATGEALASVDVVRAWKDEEYFNSLTEIQRAGLPQAPAGLVELDDSQLGGIAAGLRGQCSCVCPPTHDCAAAF